MPSNRRPPIQLTPDEQAAFFRERKKAAFASPTILVRLIEWADKLLTE